MSVYLVDVWLMEDCRYTVKWKRKTTLSLFHIYNTIVHTIVISTYMRGQAIAWFFVSTFSVLKCNLFLRTVLTMSISRWFVPIQNCARFDVSCRHAEQLCHHLAKPRNRQFVLFEKIAFLRLTANLKQCIHSVFPLQLLSTDKIHLFDL